MGLLLLQIRNKKPHRLARLVIELAAGDQRFESAVGDFGRSKLVIMVDKTRVQLVLGLFKDRGLLAPRISGESGNGSFGLASGISRDTTSCILQLIQAQLLVFGALGVSHLDKCMCVVNTTTQLRCNRPEAFCRALAPCIQC